MSGIRAKISSWVQSLASPSQTHASGMLILIGIIAAATTTDAQSVHEPVRGAKAPSSPGDATSDPLSAKGGDAEVKEYNNQDILYYVAMGMLVSQGLIRLITFISDRRAAAALAAAKKNDDLNASQKKSSRKKSGLTMNAFEELDEEAIQKRKEHLATLGEKAELLGSDTEDEDYEEDSEEEESESEEEEEEDSEEEEEDIEESESESEIERRRRVLAAGDAPIEE
ncbi:hypothetical protein EMPS_10776 [Entomortierella parvispora]|uniref:Uncharacterized protein n=1 Tax=Entomortierella parvispora TaxID=205924 RepID=A0A9P3HKM9_9FUNG|nr:hypothetical protein EMPS_10776 [Entomortierella parvispora]